MLRLPFGILILLLPLTLFFVFYFVDWNDSFFFRLSLSFPAAALHTHEPFLLRAGTPDAERCSTDRIVDSLYTFEAGPHEFYIRSDADDPFDVLFARMLGPDLQHFSCFLERQRFGYACPAAIRLPHGLWSVSIVLVRRQCVSLTANSSLLDYLFAGRISQFQDLLTDLKYPQVKVLQFKWNKEVPTPSEKVANIKELNNNRSNAAQQKCTEDSVGVWLQLGSCTGCEAAELLGEVDARLLNHPYNTQLKIRHVFKPFDCSYAFLSKEQAATCLSARRPVLVGDSRVRQLYEHMKAWLGAPASVNVTFLGIEKPLHFGLDYFFGSNLPGLVRQKAQEGRMIIMNSLLHDVADFARFGPSTLVEDVRKYLGPDYCPEYCPKPEARLCNCSKSFAPQRYLSNIKRLAAFFESLRKEEEGNGASHHYWISYNKRPPDTRETPFAWQSTDILIELEDAASDLLTAEGIGHIDFRPHLLSSPQSWWTDMVHYGQNSSSFMQHWSLQILLNKICEIENVGRAER